MERDPEGGPGKRLILVLGMHRSGTSALTGLLAKLGVELGDELLPPTRSNPKGYFEHSRVFEAHEALLEALHRGWMDPRSLPEGWTETAAAVVARDVLAGLVADLSADAGVVAVKDPRICRMLPLWLEVAARAGARPAALLAVRHPDEVAGSLERRGGMSRERAHLLWMTHLLEAERDSRELPRAFVSYDALLADWRAELGRIGEGLPGWLPAPDRQAASAIDGFLDDSLRNHRDGGVPAAGSPFGALALELHRLALRGTVDPSAAGLHRDFDAFAEKLRQRTAHYLELPMQIEDGSREATDDPRVDRSLELARALHELWRPSMVQDILRTCRLYYRRSGAQFAEDRAIVAEPVPVEGGQQVEFELPAGTGADFLRLDPDEAPGVFALQSLSIDGRPVADLAERVVTVNELRLPVSSRRSAVRFAALGEDPHVEFDVRGLERRDPAVPMRVVARFRTETMLSEACDVLEDAALDLQDGLRALGERERRLVGDSARLQAIAGDVLASTESISRRIDEERRRRLDESACMADALQAIRAQGDRLASEVADLRGRQDFLSDWMRRRSIGYWWRRMLGRGDDWQDSR